MPWPGGSCARSSSFIRRQTGEPLQGLGGAGRGVLPGAAQGEAGESLGARSSLAPMPSPALLHAPTSSAELCSSRHWQILVLTSCPRAGNGATKARHLPDDLHHHYSESVCCYTPDPPNSPILSYRLPLWADKENPRVNQDFGLEWMLSPPHIPPQVMRVGLWVMGVHKQQHPETPGALG